MSESPAASALPVVAFLRIPITGSPYLEGSTCQSCNAIFLGQRAVCSKCGARDQFEVCKLSNRGTLYTYSIVHRSLPGVAVPYVSAIVDLEGGGTVKGNLINVAPDPAHIPFGMPVELVYADALGRKDCDGHAYVSYFFQPLAQSSRRTR